MILKSKVGRMLGMDFLSYCEFLITQLDLSLSLRMNIFLNCRISEDYGSPLQFLTELSGLNANCLVFIAQIEAKLNEIEDKSIVSDPVWPIL